MGHPQHGLPNFVSWWSGSRQLWWRDFDSLGHVTASSYCVAYHDVFEDFMVEAWKTRETSYVVRRICIEHLSEIPQDEDSLRIYVRINHVGQSAIQTSMILCGESGVVASTAECVYVAWDRESRCSRPMTNREREGLLGS